jgi:DUF1680 family protein
MRCFGRSPSKGGRRETRAGERTIRRTSTTTQRTNRCTAETEFSVKIRNPQRNVSQLYSGAPESDGILSLAVNGNVISPDVAQGYTVIKRTWNAGDEITLRLPMKIQRIERL